MAMLGNRKQSFKFDTWSLLRIGTISLIGILLLAACRSNNPTPTVMQVTETAVSSPTATSSLIVTSSPAATQLPAAQATLKASATPGLEATQPGANAYPGPQGGPLAPTIAAYPAPGSGASPTEGSPGPYPAPEENNSSVYPSPGSQAQPTFANPYPGPTTSPTVQAGATSTPTQTPVSPGGSTPSVTPAATPTAGPTAPPLPSPTPIATAATPLPSPTVAATATPFPSLRTDLLATKPSTVKLASGKPELIVFFAYWDGDSRIMMPVLLNLQDQFGTRVNFVYLDIDDPATAPFRRDLYYESQPQSFLLGPDGKILRKWRGVIQQSDLQQAIEGALNG